MKEYTDVEIQEKYDKFLEGIKKAFKNNPERVEKLLHMYSEDELGLSLAISPASGNVHYHNAYPGGYIDHVENVVNIAIQMHKMYVNNGGKPNYELEELIFAAFHHDLGKLGDGFEPNYVPNDSKWHIENQGKVYVRNPHILRMEATDRTFWLLQHYGIDITENEWFGIKLADGMYRDENKWYFVNYSPENFLQVRIPYILHWSDHMATTIERDQMEV